MIGVGIDRSHDKSGKREGNYMKKSWYFATILFLLCALAPASAVYGQEQRLSLGIPCTLTVDVGSHGKVTRNRTIYTGAVVGSFQVEPGTLVSFQINPDSGYGVSLLTLSGKDVLFGLYNGVYSITVNEDETLVVRFSKAAKPDPTPTATATPTPTATPTSRTGTTPDPNRGGSTPFGGSDNPGGNVLSSNPFLGPITGDESAAAFWFAVLVVSMLTIVIVTRKRKK